MAFPDRSLALASGKHMGWARSFGSEDWEDMVGAVTVFMERADESGVVNVTITSLEFGAWTGVLDVDTRVAQGPTGQEDTIFKLALQIIDSGDRFKSTFRGGIQDAEGRQLLELSLSASIDCKPDDEYFRYRIRDYREYFAGHPGFVAGAELCDRLLVAIDEGVTTDQAIALFSEYQQIFLADHLGGTGWEQCWRAILHWLAFILDRSPEIADSALVALAGLFKDFFLNEATYSSKWAPDCVAFCDQWTTLIEQSDDSAIRELLRQVAQLPRNMFVVEFDRFVALWGQRVFRSSQA
jgi:hypothetical protein